MTRPNPTQDYSEILNSTKSESDPLAYCSILVIAKYCEFSISLLQQFFYTFKVRIHTPSRNTLMIYISNCQRHSKEMSVVIAQSMLSLPLLQKHTYRKPNSRIHQRVSSVSNEKNHHHQRRHLSKRDRTTSDHAA